MLALCCFLKWVIAFTKCINTTNTNTINNLIWLGLKEVHLCGISQGKGGAKIYLPVMLWFTKNMDPQRTELAAL